MATAPAPAKEAASTAAPPPPAAAPRKATPEDIDFIFGQSHKPLPKTEELTDEQKAAAAAKAEEDRKTAEKKAADDKAKTGEKAGEGEKSGEEKKTTTTPAKRVIKRAKDYADVPAVPAAQPEAMTKLADAVDKLADKVNKPAAPQEPQLQLDEDEQYRLQVFEAMADLDKKHASLAANAKKYLAEYPVKRDKLEQQFKTTWEKRNPDTKFDNEGERNDAYASALERELSNAEAEWKEKAGVTFSERDYMRGVVHLETKPLKEENSRLKKETEHLSDAQRERNARTEAEKFSGSAVSDLSAHVVEHLGKDFEGVLTEAGEIDDKAVEKLPDPELVAPLRRAVELSKGIATAITTVANGGRTPHLNAVLDLADDFEAEMSTKPEEERADDDGRLFATRTEWEKLTPEQKGKRWMIDPDRLIAFANDAILKQAAKTVDTERAKLKAIEERTLRRFNIDPKTVKNGEAKAKEEGTPPARTPKPNSPASTDGAAPAKAPANAVGDFLMSHMRGQT